MPQRSSDQWKAGGDCSICRREKYCKTECTEHQRRLQRFVRSAFYKTKAGKLMAAIEKTLADAGHKPEYLDE